MPKIHRREHPLMEWPANILGGMDPQQFLAEYWQKKPLLIRNAVPGFVDPLEPADLAGLACEDEIASRLVIEKDAPRPWQVSHGPFDDEDFASLPPSHWTLLVQDLNRYVPALARLLDRFNFVPGWRVDDVMVSYAPSHGTVGPHTDNYDVFLLQGMGERRWQINASPDAPAGLIAGLDLRILQDFHAEQEWTLQAGDMLYLPPGVQHYGVAMQDCLTYSVGFRAPDRNELLVALAQWLSEQPGSAPRYTDPDLQLPTHPGRIPAQTLQQVRALLDQSSIDDWSLLRWFTAFTTSSVPDQTDYFDNPSLSIAELITLWQQQDVLLRNPLSRFAYAHEGNHLALCINGECQDIDANALPAIQLLCDRHELGFEQVRSQLEHEVLRQYWLDWFNHGYLGLDDSD